MSWKLIYLEIWGFIHEYVFLWIISATGGLMGYGFILPLTVGFIVNWVLNHLANKFMDDEGFE